MNSERTRQDAAFVGVSLDSRLFSRDWIRYALSRILGNHESLMFLLADDLYVYTRTAKIEDETPIVDFSESFDLANDRRRAVLKKLLSEVDQLGSYLRNRVEVRRWSDFADARYVGILRSLHIAFAVLTPFSDSVKHIAAKHAKNSPARDVPSPIETGAAFILDEMAMCLRITELGGYSSEYYPSEDLPALTQLYSGQFERYGLTVEKLTGVKPNRTFNTLKLM